MTLIYGDMEGGGGGKAKRKIREGTGWTSKELLFDSLQG